MLTSSPPQISPRSTACPLSNGVQKPRDLPPVLTACHLRPPPPKPTAVSLSRGSTASQTLLSSCSNLQEVEAALLRALGWGSSRTLRTHSPNSPTAWAGDGQHQRPGRWRRRIPAGAGRQALVRHPITSFAGIQPCSLVYSSPPTAEASGWPTKPKTFTIKSVLTPGLGCQQPCPLWAVSWLPPRWSASACARGAGTAVPTAHHGP